MSKQFVIPPDAQDPTDRQSSIIHNQQFWEKRYQKEGHIWGEEPSMCARTIADRLHGTGKNVIDVGCGYGRDLIYLAKQGFQVTGVDISETGLSLGKEWACKEGVEAIFCFRKEMKFDTYKGCCDAVISNRVMHLLLRPEERQEFINHAQKNIQQAQLSHIVQPKQQDITQGITETNIDAIILDIPNPWEAINHCWQALKTGGYICTYSPLISQVEQTVHALKKHPFIEINSQEQIIRNLVISPQGTRPSFNMLGHTGYLTFARKIQTL